MWLIDIRKNGMFGVTDKDKTCNGTFLENISTSVVTKHAEMHPVIED